MFSLASPGFTKKKKRKKLDACQSLRIGIFHMKAWISGFSRKSSRPGRAGPSCMRPQLPGAGEQRHLQAGCNAPVGHSLHHSLSAPGRLHSLIIPITCLASISFCLRSPGFRTANSLSQVSEELGLSFSSFITLSKLLPLTTL